MNATILLSLLLAVSVEEHLDGAEIGDAVQFVSFQSGGKYLASRKDAKAGPSNATGSWKVEGEKLTVKVASCKGPACKKLGQPFSAEIGVVAERAMTVKSSPPDSPLPSGSYYCHFQGCEKRVGVQIVTSGARAAVMKYLVDFLIDKNRTRDVTVVWWGKKLGENQAQSSVTWCKRDGEYAKAGAEGVAKDLN